MTIIDQFLGTVGWSPALSTKRKSARAVKADCDSNTLGHGQAAGAMVGGATANALVLVVDDQDSARQGLMKLLSQEGYRVTSAVNGIDAIDAVVREEPDLVLMDVMMPELDGFEACRSLKSLPATRLTPIVLVTALQDSKDRIRGIEAGADDFISKPINFHELKARVQSLVRIKRYTDELDTAAAVILSLSLTIEARDRYTEATAFACATTPPPLEPRWDWIRTTSRPSHAAATCTTSARSACLMPCCRNRDVSRRLSTSR
jgi:CheY-like chemotaxis protein